MSFKHFNWKSDRDNAVPKKLRADTSLNSGSTELFTGLQRKENKQDLGYQITSFDVFQVFLKTWVFSAHSAALLPGFTCWYGVSELPAPNILG